MALAAPSGPVPGKEPLIFLKAAGTQPHGLWPVTPSPRSLPAPSAQSSHLCPGHLTCSAVSNFHSVTSGLMLHCLPRPQDVNLRKAGTFVFFVPQLCPRCLEELLAHSRSLTL